MNYFWEHDKLKVVRLPNKNEGKYASVTQGLFYSQTGYVRFNFQVVLVVLRTDISISNSSSKTHGKQADFMCSNQSYEVVRLPEKICISFWEQIARVLLHVHVVVVPARPRQVGELRRAREEGA